MNGKKIKACLICNPLAGKAKKNADIIDGAISYLIQEGFEIKKMLTDGPLTAMHIARDAAQSGFDYIIATGGDGTINEVANGLYNSESILMILPMGTANLFAHHIGLPIKISEALKSYKDSKVIKINLGKANDRYFLLMAGIGFDSNVISKIKPSAKLKYGKLAFVYHSIKESFLYDYPLFRIKIKDRQIDSSFAVISLSKEYAGLFTLTPGADISKRTFQICAFHKRGALNYWKYFIFALMRKHHILSDVTLTYADNVEVSPIADKKVLVQLDGELYCNLPIQIMIAPQQINILVPQQRIRKKI